MAGRHNGSSRAGARGVALLTALFVVALATVAAAAMAYRQQVYIRRATNQLDADQAYLQALGVESWALGMLASDARENATDSPADGWAKPLGPLPVENGRVSGYVEDLTAFFNLNNLLQAGGEGPGAIDTERFDRLLEAVGAESGLRPVLVDWLDPDTTPVFPGGAEDDRYLRETPARRTANGIMVDASELRLLLAPRPEDYDRLAPYVVALPDATPINVNTAPAPVLMAIAKGMSENDARAVVAARQEKPFENVEQALQHPAFAGLEVNVYGLAVASRYFRVRAFAQVGRGQVELVSVVARPENGPPTVLRRHRGNG
jgi:general secretion pathway protein K